MAVMKEFWSKVDTVVSGRKTHDFARGQSTGEMSFPGVTSYVCSRTLPAGRDGATEIVNDGVALLRDLKSRPGKDICIMGGGELAASLFDADLIDEVGMNIHPILLGSGVPFIGRLSKPIKLQLLKSEMWTNGCVLVTYGVVR
jgi:dihydrofolate reductase